MNRTRILTAAAGTTLIGAAALFSSVASAGNNVAWSVSVGGPGFTVSAGEPAYGYGRGFVSPAYYGAPHRPYYTPYYRPHYRPVVVAPPVVYSPYYAPYPAYAPYRPYYAPRVVYAPRRW
jgi:hypothetical protein